MTISPIRRTTAAIVLALAVAGCGDEGGTAEVGAELSQGGEDTDNPTPAPPPPTVMEGCPADSSPEAAGAALSATPAWSVLEREAANDIAALSSLANGVVTGEVTAVEQGGWFPSEQAAALGFDDESVRLTVNLVLDVESVEGGLSESIHPGSTVAVPLVVFDGSIEGLPEDQVAIMHTNYARQLDCAVPRSDVVVIGTVGDLAAAGEGTSVDAVVELPRLAWLPDPAAVTFSSEGGVESLDWLIGDAAADRFFHDAGTLDGVAAAARDALG